VKLRGRTIDFSKEGMKQGGPNNAKYQFDTGEISV